MLAAVPAHPLKTARKTPMPRNRNKEDHRMLPPTFRLINMEVTPTAQRSEFQLRENYKSCKGCCQFAI